MNALTGVSLPALSADVDDDELEIYYGQEEDEEQLVTNESLLLAKLQLIESALKENSNYCAPSQDVRLKVPFTMAFAGPDETRVYECILALLHKWRSITSDTSGELLKNVVWCFMQNTSRRTIARLYNTVGEDCAHIKTNVPVNLNLVSNTIVVFDKLFQHEQDQGEFIVLRAITEPEEVLSDDIINDLQFL